MAPQLITLILWTAICTCSCNYAAKKKKNTGFVVRGISTVLCNSPTWGRGKVYIGVLVRAWVSQHAWDPGSNPLWVQVFITYNFFKKLYKLTIHKQTQSGEETCQTSHTMYTWHKIILLICLILLLYILHLEYFSLLQYFISFLNS